MPHIINQKKQLHPLLALHFLLPLKPQSIQREAHFVLILFIVFDVSMLLRMSSLTNT